MKRGIDHLVLCVRDLSAAEVAYRRLGFTTTPRAIHPFGTGNHLVQLQGCFLELLAVVEPEKIAPAAVGSFSFGPFNRDFLARREGMSMLVLESNDARRDHAEFVARKLDTYAPFDFERQAKLPDGQVVTVGFSLAFVTDARMPEAAFFTCQQHAPQYFWKPEYQRHANGAQSVAEVLMVAADPAALRGLFERLQEPESVTLADGALRAATPRGAITVLTPQAFAARFPGATLANAPQTPHYVGYRIAVADLGLAARVLAANGVAPVAERERLWIRPEDAFGAVIEFA